MTLSTHPIRIFSLKECSIAVVLALLMLAMGGCADREISRNPDGTDKMRISPCACAELDFNQDDQGFVWQDKVQQG